MVGCSNGGRHALVGATRLANEFDGFLAGAPGYNLPMVALQHAWDVQSFDLAGGDIRRAVSRDEHAASWPTKCVQQCDALDGAADGIVGAIAACQQDVRSAANCAARRAAARPCLAEPQVDGARALVRRPEGPAAAAALLVVAVRCGPRRERLAQLEAREPDSGLRRPAADRDARRGLARADLHDAAGASRRHARGAARVPRAFDFDRDAPKILATTREYPVSAMDFMAPTDWRQPKLAELKAAGGKVIVYHGASDGAFSLQATIDWFEKLRANNGGDVGALARFYPVPGMTHCGGGPSTDRFDLFSAARRLGRARQGADGRHRVPRAPTTASGRRGWSPTRSRPLCDWPKVARYRGTGDLESAESFRCE